MLNVCLGITSSKGFFFTKLSLSVPIEREQKKKYEIEKKLLIPMYYGQGYLTWI